MAEIKKTELLPPQSIIFLQRTKGRICRGEFNKYFEGVMFVDSRILFTNIRNYLIEVYETNGKTILTDVDILKCIESTILFAFEIHKLFLDNGFIERNNTQEYPSEKLELALKVIESDMVIKKKNL